MLINEIPRILAQVRFQGYPLFQLNIARIFGKEMHSQGFGNTKKLAQRLAIARLRGFFNYAMSQSEQGI